MSENCEGCCGAGTVRIEEESSGLGEEGQLESGADVVERKSEVPRRGCKRSLTHATDWIIWQARARGYRRPLRVLLVAAALLYEESGSRGGFLSLAQRALGEARELREDI